ncbi:UNVERIFIED_CONTAM: Ent-kaurenoic acid oxidase 1 [Sesamum calycinum]|uniref:Ent-kaurenoic acid oxidase 1 n=1 Tax=Sesamum calycinum TaxID=2727403 RepID=A0AAW2J1S1_9LAMI
MEMATGFWVGILAVVGWLLWWWNDILYALRSLRRTGGGAKLPPGYMGIPFLGEMLTFLWYFKILGRPDDYINSKRCKYGFFDPLLVACSFTLVFVYPTSLYLCCPNEVVFIEGDEHFTLLLLMIRIKLFLGVAFCGTTSLVAVQGSSHTRVRSFVMRAINQPDALHKIALRVQPRITVALESWAQKGRIRVYKEAKKVTFANIGKYFASLEPGLVLDTLDELFECLTAGLRFYPLNFPGTAFHRALCLISCRKLKDKVHYGSGQPRTGSDWSVKARPKIDH